MPIRIDKGKFREIYSQKQNMQCTLDSTSLHLGRMRSPYNKQQKRTLESKLSKVHIVALLHCSLPTRRLTFGELQTLDFTVVDGCNVTNTLQTHGFSLLFTTPHNSYIKTMTIVILFYLPHNQSDTN